MKIKIEEDDLKKLSLAKGETIPANWYSNSDIYEFELKNIFYKNWIYQGTKESLLGENNFTNIDLFNLPITLVQKKDNLDDFYRICRHRSGPVDFCPSKKNNFICQYHGWTYNSQGNLI